MHVSSYVVYQIPESGEVTEDTRASTAESGYAHTKCMLENDVLRAVREQSLAAVIIQPTLIYGPGSRPFTHDPADMLWFGTVLLPDKGEGLCNAVYVDDVVSVQLCGHRAALSYIRSRSGDLARVLRTNSTNGGCSRAAIPDSYRTGPC